MFKTLTKDLNKCELIDVMLGLDCEEDMCKYTSIQRVLDTTHNATHTTANNATKILFFIIL